MKSILAVLAVFVCAHGTQLPQNFKKCSRTDSDVASNKKCYLEAAQSVISQLQEGYPQVKLPSFEPLEITELKIGAGSQGVTNVDQNFKNCKVYGITKTKLEDAGFNFEEKYIYGRGLIPHVKKVCDYDLNGKILLLPIRGTGRSTVILTNLNITVRFDYEEVAKKGHTYMNFKEQKVTLDPESVSFDFENLFDSDKALGDNVHKVLNDNQKAVFEDVRSGYEEGIGLILLRILQNFFAKVSIEEAFD